MFEVEAKVSISKDEFKILTHQLKKEAQYLGARTCLDTYYNNPKKAYLRVRKRGGEHSFDIKRRQTIKGIESNIEMEWNIKDITRWKALLKKLKFAPTIQKSKKSILFKQKDFIIELNHVRLLGYYLEVERIVKSESELKKAKKELINIIKELGYSQRQFEPKPYLELLKNA